MSTDTHWKLVNATSAPEILHWMAVHLGREGLDVQHFFHLLETVAPETRNVANDAVCAIEKRNLVTLLFHFPRLFRDGIEELIESLHARWVAATASDPDLVHPLSPFVSLMPRRRPPGWRRLQRFVKSLFVKVWRILNLREMLDDYAPRVYGI